MHNLIENGYITHIAGANGAGKSTMLKKLCKHLMKSNITFSYLGHFHGLLENHTARGQIEFYKNLVGHDLALWIDLLDDIDPSSYVFELSSGQKQRLSIACHLNFKANVWVLDEPFDTLDQNASEILQRAFIRFLSEDRSIVLVDHSFAFKDNLHRLAKEKILK